jgi:hypothetical protein
MWYLVSVARATNYQPLKGKRMGTPALIARKINNDEYQVIYCHYDGYPSHTGKMLADSFGSTAAVQRLMDGGDLEAIASNGTTIPLVGGSPARTLKAISDATTPYTDFIYIFDPSTQSWSVHRKHRFMDLE